MIYMGSKSRIAKHILPIILKNRKDGQYYVEPFCGGCNTIDKVDGNRIANDINKYLIAMWKFLVECKMDFPQIISKETYSYYRNMFYNRDCSDMTSDDAMIGWVGFMGSYNGRFFDGGYSGHSVKIKNGYRNYIGESIKNTLCQKDKLIGVCFLNKDYRELKLPPCCIIYCDPPYKGVKKYSHSIDHDEFWGWCRQKVNEGHKVFVSEYFAPNDFVCIWEQELKTAINQTITKKAVERLFVHKSQI